MRIVSVCLIVFLVLFFASFKLAWAHLEYQFPQASAGQVNDAIQKLGPVRFLNSHPLYFLITFKENVSRFFQPSSAKKAEFDLRLAGKKLSEAYLLIVADDAENSQETLTRYAKRIDEMVKKLEKARSQNQEVSSLVDIIAEDLRIHETLLFAISEKSAGLSSDLDSAFDEAVLAHGRAVLVIDDIKPGLRNRFSTVEKDRETSPVEPSPTPDGSALFESSPSIRPRRIIF